MSKGPAWLLEQLPALVREGILDADSAERLRARYAMAANGGGVSRVLLATLGAVLVGLGLILLAAHNWGDWSRATRLTASLAPMLVAQVGVFTLLRWPAVAGVWREPVAAFAVLAFALALAMVGQIFHLPGDLDRYLLTCAALALPLVYLLHASLAAALYALALLGAVAADGVPSGHPLAVVAAYALLVPHLLRLWREDAAGARFVLLSTLLIPLLFANVLLSLPNVPRLGLWWLAGFGALLVLLDARLALTQRDGATYQADLAAAAQYGARYFDRDAPATQKWQATLAELAAARLEVSLPDLSASLKAVRDAQGVPPGPRVLERWRYRGGWLLMLAAE